MARYIDADAAVEEARLAYCKDCNSYNGVKCRACAFDDAMLYIEDHPTADVVPKSEISILAVQNMALAQAKHDLQLQFEEYRKLVRALSGEIEKAVSVKVARDIFEQVDGITDLLAKGLVGELEFYDMLAELKKKYTEGETNGNKADTEI